MSAEDGEEEVLQRHQDVKAVKRKRVWNEITRTEHLKGGGGDNSGVLKVGMCREEQVLKFV